MLTLEVRASDNRAELPTQPYIFIESGERFDEFPRGRHLEIRARFKGSCPHEVFLSPTLTDLFVYSEIGSLNCDMAVNNFDIDPFVALLSAPDCGVQ